MGKRVYGDVEGHKGKQTLSGGIVLKCLSVKSCYHYCKIIKYSDLKNIFKRKKSFRKDVGVEKKFVKGVCKFEGKWELHRESNHKVKEIVHQKRRSSNSKMDALYCFE